MERTTWRRCWRRCKRCWRLSAPKRCRRSPPLPEDDAHAANRHVTLHLACNQIGQSPVDLRRLGGKLGLFGNAETLEIITTALLRERQTDPVHPSEGIPVLSVHATGGEKFKVVFLCNLLQGIFPRRQRESAFLLDHEREETLRDLQVLIDTRKHLEDDEQYWFLHALSSATHRLVLSYPQHDLDGMPFEKSAFLDEVDAVLPELPAQARRTSFRELAPALADAESGEEFLAGLAFGLRTERDAARKQELAAAYAGCAQAHGHASALAELFRRAQVSLAALTAPEILAQLRARRRLFSASELQQYLDCPFAWFGGHSLGVGTVMEEFSPLDRGEHPACRAGRTLPRPAAPARRTGASGRLRPSMSCGRR